MQGASSGSEALKPRSTDSLELPDVDPQRPRNVSHLSFPEYESPLRHHRRQVSAPRHVKETLHARSEYTNSEDDGGAIHRINQYVIKQEIGRGSFGAVHLAVDQHDNEYAVKEFSKSRLRKRAQSNVLRRPHGSRPRPGHLAAGVGLNSPLHRRDASDQEDEAAKNPLYLIREEIAIMKKLNHHNLVSLYEVLDDPTEDSLYMVVEMCKKGVVMKIGMGERADPYDSESCRCWFRDLILGIEYLHAQGIVHRDIKPDNLLLSHDDVLKIVDFGVSEMFEKDSDMTTAKSAGSPAFLPPELCVGKHGKISGRAADIWSMGVTLYCLYFGRVPFERTSVLELYECIRNDTPDMEEDCNEDLADLLRRILEKDPAKRIKMEELREHPWVTKRGADPLLSFDENTANLVAPPTEEEMNHAITGNLSNLVVVMKAVRRFQGLLAKKRPYLFDSILGQRSRIVQPPLQMKDTIAKINQTVPPSLNHHPHSDNTQYTAEVDKSLKGGSDRRGIAQDDASKNLATSTIASPQQIPPGYSRPSRVDSGKVIDEHHDHGKGHAHDPLEDFLFLSVGTGDDQDREDDSTPFVSESPPAAEGNIYEAAYHEEVERIRTRSHGATLFLTRRVDEVEKYREDSGIVRGNTDPSPSPSFLSKMLGKVKESKDKGHETSDEAAEKGDDETPSLQQRIHTKLGEL